MKKKKLSLNSLEISSFVTHVPVVRLNTMKGGATVNGPNCSVQFCDSDLCPGTNTCPDGMGPTEMTCAPCGSNPSVIPGCNTGGICQTYEPGLCPTVGIACTDINC